MKSSEHVPLEGFREYPVEEMKRRAATFLEEIRRRRTVRHFSNRAVPASVIEDCLLAAGSAPSGANKQPWHFVVVTDPGTKTEIRRAAEAEEHEFYTRRAPSEWLEVLAPFGTDQHKPFLEEAPYVIVVFEQRYGFAPGGERIKHYYSRESVGLATGILITALHHAGLVSLTHTPSPMGFLNELLHRPANERAFVIVVTGYPAPDVRVPKISKRALGEIATFV